MRRGPTDCVFPAGHQRWCVPGASCCPQEPGTFLHHSGIPRCPGEQRGTGGCQCWVSLGCVTAVTTSQGLCSWWSPEDAGVTSTHPALPFRPGLHLVWCNFISFCSMLSPCCITEEEGWIRIPAPCTRAARSLCSALIVALRHLTSPPWLWHPDAAFLCSR